MRTHIKLPISIPTSFKTSTPTPLCHTKIHITAPSRARTPSMHQHYYNPMGKTYTITRRSIFTFLQNFQFFTSTPSLLAIPFAISTLVSQSIISSSSPFPLVHSRLRALFLASGFPPSSELFAILNLKLSQTILTFLFTLPFTLSFLLVAKASVIRSLYSKHDMKHAFFSWISIFNPLVTTQLCNSLVILSANASCFCIIVISFNFFDVLGVSSHTPLLLLSATGAILYSIILANAYIICNLSLIVSGVEKRGGFMPILKACVLIRGRNGTALSLAVPMNLALAGVEALFQYRVVGAYHRAVGLNSSMVLEAMLIAYLYAMLLVLDTVVGCLFLKSCKDEYQTDQDDFHHQYQIEIQERDGNSSTKLKAFELFP